MSSSDDAESCTTIGCFSGFMLTIQANAWPAGEYRFTVTMDGDTVTCEGSLPLPSCAEGNSLTCDGEGVIIAENGCQLPAEQHSFGDMHLAGAPKAVSISVERDDEVVASSGYTPAYQALRPNGPTCEPVCEQASDTLVFTN